jgi:hypothetical protein
MEETVVVCAKKQRQQKTNKDNRNMKGDKQVAICDHAPSCTSCSHWPSAVYIQGDSNGEVISVVPYMSGFIFHFAVFFHSHSHVDDDHQVLP